MKHSLIRHCSLLLILIFISFSTALAQVNPEQSRKILKEDKRVKAFSFNEDLKTLAVVAFEENTDFNANGAKSVISNYFNLGNPGTELRLQSSDALVSGIRIDRYKLFVNNIAVVHSSYNVMIRGNKILSIHAESYSIPAGFSITPSLTEADARTNALAFVNAKKYAWQALAEDKIKAGSNADLIQQLDKLIEEYYPKGELVIAKNSYGDGQARLAWKFDVYATEPLERYYIFVDAGNGKILLRDAIIKHTGDAKKQAAKTFADTSLQPQPGNNTTPLFSFSPLASELASGTTRYAGTRSFYTTRLSVPLTGMNDPNNTSAPLQYSGVDPRVPVTGPIDVFILKDDTRGGGIETYDMNGAGGLPISVPSLQSQALAFLDKDNNWHNETTAGTNEDLIRGTTFNGSNGADEASNDDYALDAHWGAEMVYDYWKNVHGRLSYDNLNTSIKSYVHYGPAYDNAFWNGSVMTYGDGSGTSANGFRPLTSLDVCGHEIGHGVCSTTSDLVYQGESGAMNEALSDIWAACIERYVKTNVDPSLPYYPFQIGEQIAADNIGLRRMDNPKAKSDPDTYGGQYWANPVCTPTLANDQCGVHNNSGVLNKWFYLLVQGPGSTTGLPLYTDDGLADNGAVINGGNNYGALGPAGTGEFIGLGFNKAEAITYLMEQLLTPNSTFAQARSTSIIAVRALYGECSQEEKSVTDAWFAVNVGPSYAGCALPVISVSTLTTDVIERAPGTDCVRYNEYNINTNLSVAQGSPVTVNFSIGATTMSADEYALSAPTVTYNTGEAGLRTIKLRIYDDAMVEPDESITVNVTSAAPALNTSFTFTVRNDDINPVFGNAITLFNENFESTANGSLPAGWSVINRTTAPTIRWTVRQDGTAPLAWSGKRAIIEQILVPGQATYDQVTEAQVILKTPLINSTGLNSIKVQFVFQSGGEPACSPACDYAQLVYSLDGTNFSQFIGGPSEPLYASVSDSLYTLVLPSYLNNKQFYLGVIWINDANGGTSASVTLDNFSVTAKGSAVESSLASTVSEKVNAETAKPSYFYSTADRELIARLLNNTANNYGCVSATLEKAGTNGFELYVSGINHHRVADKVIRMVAGNNNAGGSTNITLYYTEAEITALEAYTGLTRNQFFIYKTSASNYSGANAGNTEVTPATYTAIAGTGGSFTASFNTGLNAGFALGASIVASSGTDYFRSISSGNWNAPATWESSPTSDFASLVSPATLTPDANANDINIRNGHTVTVTANVTTDQTFVNPGATLVVTGSTLTISGTPGLTIQSSAAGTGRVGNSTGTITGNVTVERYINSDVVGRKWHLLSGIATTTAQTIRASWQEGGGAPGTPNIGTWVTAPGTPPGYDGASTAYSILTHDPTGPSWVNLAATNAGSINTQRAYMLFVRGDRFAQPPPNVLQAPTVLRTTGTLNQGTQPAVTVLNASPGYTIMGNPFASAIDLENVLTTSNLGQFFYVWDASIPGNNGVGKFRLVQKTGPGTYIATPTTGSDNTTRYIHSGQGFFLKASGGNASVVLDESHKTNLLSVVNPIVNTAGNQQIYTEMSVADPGSTEYVTDAVRVWFNDMYSAGTTDDILKVGNFSDNISSYREGKKWIVENRSMIVKNDTIFLRTSGMGIHNYRLRINTFDFVQTDVPAFLQDTWLNTSTPLSLDGSITTVDFSVTADPASSNQDRFRIVFGVNKATIPAITKAGINIYPNPVSGTAIFVQFNDMAKGVYNVRLISNTGQVLLTQQISHAGTIANYKIETGNNIANGRYLLEFIKPDRSKLTKALVIAAGK